MKRTPLKRKKSLQAKQGLHNKSRVQSKAKSEPTERRRAKKESLARLKGLCLICDQQAVHGHHIIYLSHAGEDVPENIAPLCYLHHNGGQGVHDGRIKHWDIFTQAVKKRPDIAEYMRTHIDSWAKHAPESFVYECRKENEIRCQSDHNDHVQSPAAANW